MRNSYLKQEEEEIKGETLGGVECVGGLLGEATQSMSMLLLTD